MEYDSNFDGFHRNKSSAPCHHVFLRDLRRLKGWRVPSARMPARALDAPRVRSGSANNTARGHVQGSEATPISMDSIVTRVDSQPSQCPRTMLATRPLDTGAGLLVPSGEASSEIHESILPANVGGICYDSIRDGRHREKSSKVRPHLPSTQTRALTKQTQFNTAVWAGQSTFECESQPQCWMGRWCAFVP